MIRPLRDKILLENVQEEDTRMQGGIYIPEAAQQKSERFVVVAIGTGGKDGNGDQIEFPVEPGDWVLTTQYGGTEVEHEGKKYRIVSYLDILAKVERS
jgi:chaperonin GroES